MYHQYKWADYSLVMMINHVNSSYLYFMIVSSLTHSNHDLSTKLTINPSEWFRMMDGFTMSQCQTSTIDSDH